MTSAMKYERARDRLAQQMRNARCGGLSVALGKKTSNLFRQRHQGRRHRMDVRGLQDVIKIDTERMVADVAGMAAYATVVSETLRYGMLPAVTPELKTITAGGAVSGLAIESSSFRYGLAHETVEEMELLLGDGSLVQCSRTSNPDLFYCLPNSYGTLGYILRATLKVVPAKPYVQIAHLRYSSSSEFMTALIAAAGREDVDFLDATVFNNNELCVTTAKLIDYAPSSSNYRWLRAYYASIRSRSTDDLRVADYIWRWDTDWFWCSRQFHLQHPLLRFVVSPWLLNSATYQRVMRLSQRLLPASSGQESVIQDVAIPYLLPTQ
jgi:FAD/FMN-containing dehydrogenase